MEQISYAELRGIKSYVFIITSQPALLMPKNKN